MAWQPDDHRGAEDGQADTEPHKAALATFAGGVGVGGERHAAVGAFGFLRRVGLLAVQALGHGGVLSTSVADCHARLLIEVDRNQQREKAARVT